MYILNVQMNAKYHLPTKVTPQCSLSIKCFQFVDIATNHIVNLLVRCWGNAELEVIKESGRKANIEAS